MNVTSDPIIHSSAKTSLCSAPHSSTKTASRSAEALFERALTILRRRHPADQYEVAVNLSNIAACRHARGDATNAELLFRQGLALKQAIFGPEHPEIARQLNNLAVAIAQHRPTEADELRRQASWILDALALADDIPS